MNVGVVTGTYSSIFIASPVALWVHNRFYERGAAGAAKPARGRPAEAEEADDDGDAGEGI
jgi:hypothetical protein